jgi:hypothetical protein
MTSWLRRVWLKCAAGMHRLDALFRTPAHIVETKLMLGKLLVGQIKALGIVDSLSEVEFKVFSQFGDDGIIQYLIHHLGVPRSVRTFVEFGIENYEESNTKFLLINDNWSGLVIDSSERNIEQVKASPYYWQYDLHAVAAVVTPDNINDLILSRGFLGDIGLLSIDIDGVDYWVWKSIHCVKPWIVTAEYNSVFGIDHAISVPYEPSFNRTKAHYSNLYWGCSLKALYLLAREKGYAFVGCNSAGNNAHFVREDRLGKIKAVGLREGYVVSRFRESRAPDGALNFIDGEARLHAISDMEVIELEGNVRTRIGDLYGLLRNP